MQVLELFRAKNRIDADSAKMGMWIFIFTEMLFFGGLFLVYAVYRIRYRLPFSRAAWKWTPFGELQTRQYY